MSELVYSSKRAQLWRGEALEVLAQLQTESVQLIVTDPPYGAEYHSDRRVKSLGKIEGDGADSASREVVVAALIECVRVVAQNRHLYVAGPELLREADAKVSAPAELIWVKQDGPGLGDLSRVWGSSHEKWHFYTSLHRHGGKRGAENNPVRLRRGTVIKAVKPVGLKVRHPSEKPTELLREFIESSSKPGELVLDPFAGVGSTGVAAILSGRRACLVELEARYCDIAAERLARAEKLWDELLTI